MYWNRIIGRSSVGPRESAFSLASRTKTDVRLPMDPKASQLRLAQWISRFFRKLRTYMRLRDNFVVASTQAVHHMQKALFEMNVQLSNVISDIVGETGLRITEAIIAGQRDPMQLAALCSTRIKASRETVAKSLHGNWEEALLFALKAALETYRFIQTKIQECDGCIQQHLAQFESRAEAINSPQDLKAQLHRVRGVDLTKIPGIKEQSAQIIISEVGLDMTHWKTEKQFCSFLGLCPDNSISGGKVLHRATQQERPRSKVPST
jgi:transposase